jgi:hypothetical protein
VGKANLEESQKAYFAVCEMLTLPACLTRQSDVFRNLKVLLEFEISALESKATNDAANDPTQI